MARLADRRDDGLRVGALVTRLFAAPEAEAPLTAFHESFTGLSDRYEDVARDAKHEMLAHWLLGDAERVAAILHQRCQADIQLRDYSQRDCLLLVQALVAQSPVYRTYVTGGHADARDAAILGRCSRGFARPAPSCLRRSSTSPRDCARNPAARLGS